MKTDLIKVAGYVRVSTAIQVSEGESLDTQREQITDYAKSKGWELVNIYADEGLSGGKIEYRTQFQQMIKDAKSGKFSAIIFSKLSRFARNAREYMNLSYELEQSKVNLISIKENIDPTTTTGKLLAKLLAIFAEWEHETIREQMYENKMIRWKDKRSFLGRTPLGYAWNPVTMQLEIVQKEADIYLRIVRMYVDQKMALRDIANKLTIEGVSYSRQIKDKSKNNKTESIHDKWSSAQTSYILKNPAYYGHYVLNQTVYGDGNKGAGTRRTKERKPESEAITFPIPALITKTEWDKIQASTEFKKVKTKNSNELTRSFFLRDVCYCSRCGGKMNARIGSKMKSGITHRYYACYWSNTLKKNIEGNHAKCTLPLIKAKELENAVWADVIVMFSLNPKQAFGDVFNAEKHKVRISELEQSISTLKSDLLNKTKARERLFRMLDVEDLDENELHEKLRKNQDQILTVKGNLSDFQGKLDDLKGMEAKQKEIIEFYEKNKNHYASLRKEISNLAPLDRKTLVESMLQGPIRIDHQADSEEDGPGGVQADYKLQFNPQIIERFIDEGKIKQSVNFSLINIITVNRGIDKK
ncbi:MAG TPA: recombinase family protein [Prolixibacteraceae bacterium]